MFSLREFVLKTLRGMIGNDPDYKVQKYALGWYDKEVLTEEDLLEIDTLIELQYTENEVGKTDEEILLEETLDGEETE